MKASIIKPDDILNSLGEALIATDIKGIIAKVNPVAESLTGYYEENLQGKSLETILPAVKFSSDEKLLNLVEFVLQKGKVLWASEILKPDGSNNNIIKLAGTASPLKNSEGITGGVVVTFHEIISGIQAEEKLEASERILKLFVEYAPAAIAMFDCNMNYIAFSRRYLTDYGLHDENIIGRSHYEVFPEIDERWKEIHRRCLAGAIERAEEDSFPRADGTLDWVHWEIYPWYEKPDKVGGLLLFSELITERKRIQDRLKQSEESFKGLFEQNAVPMWVYDPETLAFLAVNDAAIEHYGYSRQEFLRMTLRDIRPVEDLERLQESINQRTTVYQISGPWRHIKKDGSIILVEIGSHTLVWQGQPGIIVVAFDRTAQIQTEQALSRSETRFRELAENIQEVFWIYSHQEERIVYISPAFEKVWGRKIENLYQNPQLYIESIFKDDIPSMMEALRHQADGELSTIEYRVVRPDGSIRWIWDRSVPILESGELVRSIGVASDITDRKKAEEKYYRVLETTSDGFWIVDSSRRFLEVNEAYCSMSGYTRQEILTMSIPDVEANETAPDTDERIRKIIQQGFDIFETRHHRKDGSIFDVEVTVNLLNHELGYMICFCRDITERKVAEEKRIRLAERLNLATRASEIGIWDWDIKKNKLVWDDQMYQLYGLQQFEFGGVYEAFIKGMHPEDRNSIDAMICRVLKDEGDYDTEFRVIWPDETVHWIKAVGQVFYDEHGKPGRMVGVNYDITDKKNQDEEIRKINESLEQRIIERTAELMDLYENAPCGYHSLDGNGIFERVNDTELNWLGYTREEMVGKICILDILTSESKKVFKTNFRIFKKLGYLTDLELDFIRKSGTVMSVLVNATAIYDEYGNYIRSRSTIIDHTDRKKAETLLKEALVNLESVNKELESFSYSVSHDLRAPVRAIGGFTRILTEDYGSQLDDEGKRICDVILSSSEKMGMLIDDLLAFSRFGRTEINLAMINMEPMIRSVIDELFTNEMKDRIQVILKPLPVTKVDASLIKQVWINLISNAIKYTSRKEKAVIEISSVQEGKATTFKIRDNGIGFDMKYVNKLYGVFQRLHTEREYPGTGVGLAIVKRIVNRHGGIVWAEGKINEGAEFYFTLPK